MTIPDENPPPADFTTNGRHAADPADEFAPGLAEPSGEGALFVHETLTGHESDADNDALANAEGRPLESPELVLVDPEPQSNKTPDLLDVGAKRLDDLRALLDDTLGPMDIDYVHDVRVATRRLSEVARLAAATMPKGAAAPINNARARRPPRFGDLRDLDVTGEHLAKWHFGPALRGVRKTLLQELPPRRTQLVAKLRAELTMPALTNALDQLAGALSGKDVAAARRMEGMKDALSSRLKRRRKQLRQAIGRAARKQTPHVLHEARIAIKKLRYVLELAKETKLQKCAAERKFLKKMQEVLGDAHDTDVIMEMLDQRVPELARTARTKAAWRTWRRSAQKLQARRAGDFFMSAYSWMNDQI